jgi:CRISPR system Cascade subunit CasB
MKQSDQIARYVNGKIEFIHKNRDRAAILAKLRRAVGKETGTVPDVWELTLDLPSELAGKTDEPSYAENAAFIALTLYAMHAQGSKENANVHNADAGSLGKAAARLKTKNPENEKGIKRRFDALATAKNHNEIANHARGIIQLLKAGGIALDYARFAKDIFLLQLHDPAKNVKLGWGRDYYSYIPEEKGEENGQDNR